MIAIFSFVFVYGAIGYILSTLFDWLWPFACAHPFIAIIIVLCLFEQNARRVKAK